MQRSPRCIIAPLGDAALMRGSSALRLYRRSASCAARNPLRARCFSSLQPGPWRPALGFRQFDYGLDWYSSKDEAVKASEGRVLVCSSYEYESLGSGSKSLRRAMRYASFSSYYEYWDCISRYQKGGRPQNLHEVLMSTNPRCLYFDLDGDSRFKSVQNEIVEWLRQYVRWFFSGDRLGWDLSDPKPVVLVSSEPSKYSCHVVFPQLQFADHASQHVYLPALLTALPALEVDAEDEDKLAILQVLVDRMPYTKFQPLRGPYACKLKDRELHTDTQLVPEDSFFQSDPLTCFAGYVEPSYALPMPPLAQLLQWNRDISDFEKQHRERIAAPDGGKSISPQDAANLYDSAFQQPQGGILDLAGQDDIAVYEQALKWIHPERALQYWSWFRICGVTCSMLEQHADDAAAQTRIWGAHRSWSSSYPHYSDEENLQTVEKARGKRPSGVALLRRLVRFDNPNMDIRFAIWPDKDQDPRNIPSKVQDPFSVFVAKLPDGCNEGMLSEVFSRFGSVAETKVFQKAASGDWCGIVKFNHPQSADLALQERNVRVADGIDVVVRPSLLRRCMRTDTQPLDPSGVIVGGLPPAWVDTTLLAYFSEFGDVVDTKVFKEPKTGTSRCFGIVRFQAPESADIAIQLGHGRLVDGSPLTVARSWQRRWPEKLTHTDPGPVPHVQAMAPTEELALTVAGAGQPQQRQESRDSQPLDPSGIIVGKLPPAWNEAVLLAWSTKFGETEHAKLFTDPNTGHSRCFGIVRFRARESADLAIQHGNGSIVEGKSLTVKRSWQWRGAAKAQRFGAGFETHIQNAAPSRE